MAWYNLNWEYRREVEVDNTAGAAQTLFPVEVSLTAANFTFAHAQTDGQDIRFTAADETTIIPHWIEAYDDGAETATIWVQVPTVGAGATVSVWLYYGNPAASDTSNGDDVFTFFEGFADSDFAATFATPNVNVNNYLTYPNNPIVTITPATFYSNEVREQSQIFKIGSTYHLLFTGYNGSVYQIGSVTAASPEGPWTVQGAVIDDGEDPYLAINEDRSLYNDGHYYVFNELKAISALGVARTTDFTPLLCTA
jgi:hypothetical protein